MAKASFLRKVIANQDYRVTSADLVIATGEPLHHIEEQLQELVKRYRCSIEIDGDANIVYTFDRQFRLWKDRASWGDWLEQTYQKVIRRTRFVLKFVVGLIFFLYSVVFLTPLALAVATFLLLTSSFFFILIWGLRWEDIWGWLQSTAGMIIFGTVVAGALLFIAGGIIRHIMQFILTLSHKKEQLSKGRVARLIGFLDAIIFYTMGPTPKEPSLQKDLATVYQRIRAQGGFLLSSNLVQWLGLGLAEAPQEASRMLVEQIGTPVVTESGRIVYTFPEIMATAYTAPDLAEKTDFEQMEGPIPLREGTGGQEIAICLLIFLLFFGGIPVLFLTRDYFWLSAIFGWFPVLTATFLAIFPLFRWPFVAFINRRIQERNIRRQVYASVFSSLSTTEGLHPKTLEREVEDRLFEYRFSPMSSRKVTAAIGRQIQALSGLLDGNGEFLAFEELKEDLLAFQEYHGGFFVSPSS